jgi:hypothetical protein
MYGGCVVSVVKTRRKENQQVSIVRFAHNVKSELTKRLLPRKEFSTQNNLTRNLKRVFVKNVDLFQFILVSWTLIISTAITLITIKVIYERYAQTVID